MLPVWSPVGLRLRPRDAPGRRSGGQEGGRERKEGDENSGGGEFELHFADWWVEWWIIGESRDVEASAGGLWRDSFRMVLGF